MAREQALDICKNIKRTLSKHDNNSCNTFSNPIFDKPHVHQGILKRKLKSLIKEYNINKEEL